MYMQRVIGSRIRLIIKLLKIPSKWRIRSLLLFCVIIIIILMTCHCVAQAGLDLGSSCLPSLVLGYMCTPHAGKIKLFLLCSFLYKICFLVDLASVSLMTYPGFLIF